MNKIIFSLFILTNLTVKAQFIVAGQHGPRDYYVIADTSLPYDKTYSIDMNGDSTTDIEIPPDIGGWHIRPDSNNRVSNLYIQYDNCIQTERVMIKPFHLNDTINSHSLWDEAVDDPRLTSYTENGHGICEFNLFAPASDTGYIGVQVFWGLDTLYG